jgi:Ca2+-binding RTX toxin-like protein
VRSIRLSTAILAVLAGCAPQGLTDDDEPGDDVEPYLPGDVEGIDEASEALTDLSTQCTFTGSSGRMTLTLNAGDLALVARVSSGALLVNGFDCHGATAAKVTTLAVTQGTSGVQTLILDYTGGPFGAGRNGAPGVTIDLGADAAADAYKVIGAATVDTITFGTAGMTINGDAFVDVTIAGADQIVLNLGDGNDVLSGAGSAASGGPFLTRLDIYGGAGNDSIRGGAGDDLYFGGVGNDTFLAGPGDDGSDAMSGGEGTDTADYGGRGANLSLSIDGVANDGEVGSSEGDDLKADIEAVRGGSGNDTVAGGAGPQTLSGGPGNDTLRGGPGNDILSGEAGNDRFDEEAAPTGADVMNGGAGTDTADYSGRSQAVTVAIDGLANDGQSGEADKVSPDVENVTGGAGNDLLTGAVTANLLVGGGGTDTLLGSDGADTLRGGLGNDVLDGGPGDDLLDAEAAASGADTLRGGAGVDRVDYSARSAAVDVTMDGATGSGESGEGDKVGADVEHLRGTPHADTLRGNALDNLIEGGGDDDLLFGLAGDDILDGEAGDDALDCGAGDADIQADNTTTSATSCEL